MLKQGDFFGIWTCFCFRFLFSVFGNLFFLMVPVVFPYGSCFVSPTCFLLMLN